MENVLDIYTKKENNLLQSEKWAKYQETLGLRTWLLSCDEGNVLVIKLPLYKDKNYLYVPRGPRCSVQGWSVFLKKVKEIAQEENCVFIRVEPFMVPNGTLKKLGFNEINKHSPMSHQYSPMNTLLLDLRKEEDELLAEMKPKGRYNIKLAERKNVTVRQSQKKEDLKTFYKLSLGMKERGYSSFDIEHYAKLVESLVKSKNIKMFVAEHSNKILAVLIVSFFGKTAIYLHGASSNEHRELMPNNLAQWEAIKEAKKRGCEVYDFWGIAPKDELNHPWSGITRFKENFGGEAVQFLGAYDFTFQPLWYKMFSLVNVVRKGLK
jgi:lipid II:glycine glycyltransferase (peptidoglycan interpeptide bridge formation enzyme)